MGISVVIVDDLVLPFDIILPLPLKNLTSVDGGSPFKINNFKKNKINF